MTSRRTALELAFIVFTISIFSANSASAQYTVTVNKPVVNSTDSIKGIDMDVQVSWITQMSTAVSTVDVTITVLGKDRTGPLVGKATSKTTVS